MSPAAIANAMRLIRADQSAVDEATLDETEPEDAAVAGMTRLVVDQEFSPAAVNARLRT